MRSITIVCLFNLIFTPLSAQNLTLSEAEIQEEIADTEKFVEELNAEFKNPEESPLEEDSIATFTELHFFPINPDFIVKASFQRIEDGRSFEMPTTTKRKPIYKDFALLVFSIRGVEYRLHAYQNVEFSKKEGYEDYLFIPYNDHTNGIESYGGGRYIDLREPEGEEIILNFNKSYNPYCSYNANYSCPIPPEENKLELRVEAGVLKYH